MKGEKEYINPKGLMKNPAFSQVVTTQSNGKTIYIGGQNAVTENREIIGGDNLALQTKQALTNIETALTSCGANLNDLIKLTIYIVPGQDIRLGFEASQSFLQKIDNPPIISVLIVAGLANPNFLVEIEAIAFVTE